MIGDRDQTPTGRPPLPRRTRVPDTDRAPLWGGAQLTPTDRDRLAAALQRAQTKEA